jgi:hypothetical protein
MITHLKIGSISTILAGTIAACTSLGLAPNLASDCATQATLLRAGIAQMPKLMTSERQAIDAQVSLSKAYCSGTLPVDQIAASKAVEASNVQISAVLAIAATR